MLLKQPLLLLVIICIFVLLFLFILLPLFNIFKFSFTTPEGKFSLAAFREIVFSKRYMTTFMGSMQLGVISAVLATIVGYVFAFALTRTEMRWKKFFRAIATLPIISPPFILSLSMIFLFGRQGIITKGLFGITDSDVYGLRSLVIIQVISFFPVAFLTLTGILESIDTSVEDAAYNLGASRWHIFRTVTLPLSAPGIVSALLLVFIQSLEDFSNPAVIAGSFSTLAVEAYRQITGMFDITGGSVMALLLLFPTLCAFLLQKYWLKGKSFVTVSGKPSQERRKLHEPYIVWPLFAFCMIIAVVIIVLYGTVLLGAFVKTWGINYSLTLDHFTYAWSVGKNSLQSSMTLAAIAAPLGGILGMVIAYLLVRKRFLGRKLMEVTSMLTFAIPGTVLGLAYITTFNTPISWLADTWFGGLYANIFGKPPFLLTGTAVILIAAFMFRNLPVAIEAGTATLLQIDRSIEEASTILGANSGVTFRKVILPLLRQAFFSGLVYEFVKAITAVSAIIFLVSPRWDLVTRQIFGLFESSKYSDAAALVLMMIVVILVGIGIINILVNVLLNYRLMKQIVIKLKKKRGPK